MCLLTSSGSVQIDFTFVRIFLVTLSCTVRVAIAVSYAVLDSISVETNSCSFFTQIASSAARFFDG